MVKPPRGFPLQYRLLALAFERGAGVELSRDFHLHYRLFIALALERGAVVRISTADTAKLTA